MTHTATNTFFALFGQMAARAWRVFNNRRQFAELKHWSDDQLKDIGLTRSDVRRALALPFYSDPTSVLTGSASLGTSMNLSAANAQAKSPDLKIVDACQDKCGPLAA
ncbi:MAG: DUF1127 domain-containing protein [Roseibium sp.]|uniref:DUF1127 domain-containing protein n=1 Tax=Roseibium sp. TaxID=1936156 RepID=UPI00261CECE6|nr:DUF1127 domain-containing protein [Roseibium sp.]MCV0426061.1 DUF1127 domain-containing protein [Roseibium sp.]